MKISFDDCASAFPQSLSRLSIYCQSREHTVKHESWRKMHLNTTNRPKINDCLTKIITLQSLATPSVIFHHKDSEQPHPRPSLLFQNALHDSFSALFRTLADIDITYGLGLMLLLYVGLNLTSQTHSVQDSHGHKLFRYGELRCSHCPRSLVLGWPKH
jgi:hypothetical protein